MKIILASTSKFKNEILNKVGIKHDCIAPRSEEISEEKNPYKYVCELSLNKALSVKKIASEDIIIGLDSIVLINNQIIEKPHNLEEARRNLQNSSENESKVITGITLINQQTNEIITRYQETKIKFKKITEDDIDYYIANEPDVLFASGFIIENIASNFIEEIHGSFYNILGVPVEKIYEILNEMNIYLSDIN